MRLRLVLAWLGKKRKRRSIKSMRLLMAMTQKFMSMKPSRTGKEDATTGQAWTMVMDYVCLCALLLSLAHLCPFVIRSFGLRFSWIVAF